MVTARIYLWLSIPYSEDDDFHTKTLERLCYVETNTSIHDNVKGKYMASTCSGQIKIPFAGETDSTIDHLIMARSLLEALQDLFEFRYSESSGETEVRMSLHLENTKGQRLTFLISEFDPKKPDRRFGYRALNLETGKYEVLPSWANLKIIY